MGKKKEKIITPEFRVSYPSVFTPKLNQLNGKEEYSMVALFKKGEDLSALKEAAQAAVIEKWGPDKKKWPTLMRSPFRDQGEREQTNDNGDKYLPDGYERGAIFLTLRSKQQPGLVDQKRKPIIDETEFYPGCWARASVSCYAYDMAGNRGVAFGLTNIQKVRDGEPFSGRPKAEDEFTAIEGASDVDDPFAQPTETQVADNPF